MTCSAGDVLEYQTSSRASTRENEEKNEFMGQALGLMGYDAVGLGEKDLAFGPNYLHKLQEEYGVRFLCANAQHRKTGELFFDPYVIREQDGLRVAFIAIVSPERHIIAQVESALFDKQIELKDPTETVNRYLPEMREKADIVVLLSHAGIETSEFLAKDLDVDVVIVGHYPAIENDPRDIDGKAFAMAGAKSDRFGTLELTAAADGGLAGFSGDAIRLLSKGPSDPEVAKLETAWDQWEKDNRKARQLAQQRAREKEQMQKTAEKVHERNGVLGAESCKACHEPVYESWMATPHATAFATLATADAWDNPDCIGCHVTGVQDKHYVADVNLPPEVWNVQCEECHGSGLHHARDGSYVTAGESTCLVCHNPENSPEFDYAVYSEYGVH